MAKQYFFMVAYKYDECTIPRKVFLQEEEAIKWGRREATSKLVETNDSNYEYWLYKQEITRTGDLKKIRRLYPYPTNGKTVKELITPPCFDDDCFGADFDIDKEKTVEPASEEEQRLIEIDDRIDKYLKGKMTTEEEADFFFDCKHDVVLKERAQTVALLAKALRK